jgi:hypothetical protein
MLCSSKLVLFSIDACRKFNFEFDSVASVAEPACLVFATPSLTIMILSICNIISIRVEST